MNNVFFSEKGLTSTSASHLADLAQETLSAHEAKLKNLSFVTTRVDIVGSPSESGKLINLGYDADQLSEVKHLLEEMAAMNAFCAWMREAVKAKEHAAKEVSRCSFEAWCKLMGHEEVEIPESPQEIQRESVVDEMSIKERNRYFQLEAYAATIGKYIHSGGWLASAREDLQHKLMKPYTTDGSGKDTLIYAHTPSVEPEKVEEVFFELQKLHRQNERELNRMKFAIKQETDRKNLTAHQAYKSAYEQASLRYHQLLADYKAWQIKETDHISRWKIVVPEALQGVYDKLSALEN